MYTEDIRKIENFLVEKRIYIAVLWGIIGLILFICSYTGNGYLTYIESCKIFLNNLFGNTDQKIVNIYSTVKMIGTFIAFCFSTIFIGTNDKRIARLSFNVFLVIMVITNIPYFLEYIFDQGF